MAAARAAGMVRHLKPEKTTFEWQKCLGQI